ncbi:hypothetical protein DFJ73DRAFT_8511 [Zopfochytrium polystomum]|nr:hypothetical protein DFJ73DRAFT_8511 [Zopfochytrium polystomum]
MSGLVTALRNSSLSILGAPLNLERICQAIQTFLRVVTSFRYPNFAGGVHIPFPLAIRATPRRHSSRCRPPLRPYPPHTCNHQHPPQNPLAAAAFPVLCSTAACPPASTRGTPPPSSRPSPTAPPSGSSTPPPRAAPPALAPCSLFATAARPVSTAPPFATVPSPRRTDGPVCVAALCGSACLSGAARRFWTADGAGGQGSAQQGNS